MLEKDIFKRAKFEEDLLLKYGFCKEGDTYSFQKLIYNSSFEVVLKYYHHNMEGKIIDLDTGEEYINYRIENQTGEFAGRIREEYLNLLQDIKKQCCVETPFVSTQANRITSAIKKTYQDSPEFLWDDQSTAVFRNKDNKKWYGIIMYINQNKLDSKNRMVEVMNVKLPPELIEQLVLKKGFYRAYHMNKKYWISFLLDDTIPDSELLKYIDISYRYTIKTKK